MTSPKYSQKPIFITPLKFQTSFCVKGVHLDNLEWTAENGVVDIVLTVNPVTMSVECVHVAVRTGIMDRTVITVRYEHTSFAICFKFWGHVCLTSS